MADRKKAQALLYEYIDKFAPGSVNLELYKQKFDKMSDKEFDTFITELEQGKTRLVIVCPNGDDKRLDIERNIRIAQELGEKCFQQVWVPAKLGARGYLTPNEYLIMPIPTRRQAQLLSKKISLAEDNRSVDSMTGQPTGRSKAAQISYPEVKTMAAMGLDNSLAEVLKYRGGDEGGFRAMNILIDRAGHVNMADLQAHSTGVKSTQALSKYLKACHLKSTL